MQDQPDTTNVEDQAALADPDDRPDYNNELSPAVLNKDVQGKKEDV